MPTARWQVSGEYTPNVGLLEQLIKLRGVENTADFISPPAISSWFNNLPSEFTSALKKAALLIKLAMNDKRLIVIHGDYDADGICATSILYSAITQDLGYDNCRFFIPDRFKNGYGLSKSSIEEVVAWGKGEPILIITVDSGITAKDEVDLIHELGHQIIITDHHQKPADLPAADAVVWHDQIVGASVAWLLSRAVGSTNPKSLQLAALATVTDLQPILDFNRSIVKFGLQKINSEPILGLSMLIEVAKRKLGEITTYDLGWVIGPRLNASGRLESATQAVDLFVCKDPVQARDLACRLDSLNNERQDKTLEMYELAKSVDSGDSSVLPHIIVSASTEYHEGIIGLVAARIVQTYYRPAIVISINDGEAKGSVRSVPGINIIEFLRKFEESFESLGGHPMAAGFSIKTEKIDELKALLIQAAAEEFDEALLVPSYEIDLELPIDLITIATAQALSELEPYGLSNREPVFVTKNLRVVELSKIGRDNQHLIIKLKLSERIQKAIYFNKAELANELNLGDLIDIVYTLKVNSFNGKEYLDLIIKDLRVSV